MSCVVGLNQYPVCQVLIQGVHFPSKTGDPSVPITGPGLWLCLYSWQQVGKQLIRQLIRTRPILVVQASMAGPREAANGCNEPVGENVDSEGTAAPVTESSPGERVYWGQDAGNWYKQFIGER